MTPVLQTHVLRLAILEAKRAPIIGGDRDRVFAFALSLQRMELSAGKVYIFENGGTIQEVQPDAEAFRHVL